MTLRTLVVARQTFIELARQPVHAVVVVLTLIAYAVGPHLALFSFLRGEARLLDEFGTSTLLLAGWLLASLGASSAVGRELETGTALRLFSTPVSRGAFLGGKLAGVAAFLALTTYLFTIALLLANRRGPAVSRHESVDWPALIAAAGSLIVAAGAACARYLARERSFSASLLGFSAVALTVFAAAAALFDPRWGFAPSGSGFDPLIARAAVLSFLALVVLAAFAVSVSVWLSRGSTFVLTALLFVAGLCVGSLPGAWRSVFFWIPDFRFFWAGELFYQRQPALPLGYLLGTFLYALAYSGAFLALGTAVLRRRVF